MGVQFSIKNKESNNKEKKKKKKRKKKDKTKVINEPGRFNWLILVLFQGQNKKSNDRA